MMNARCSKKEESPIMSATRCSSKHKVVRFFSLSLSLASFSRGFVFVFQVASRPFSSRGETFSHRRRRRVNRKRGVSSGGVVFCRPARRRRRRRRLHSARTSVPRRRAEVLRIERGFAFGGCALPRFAARALREARRRFSSRFDVYLSFLLWVLLFF